MAINIPIITEFVDDGLKSAQGAFNNFKTQVGQAEGAMGKFKVGSGAALDAVKANIGTLAVAGGAALAGFAVKAIGEFNDLALAAGKFSDATGLSAEEASRWTEVAGDVGVEATSVQKSIDKMNKSIADSTPEWKQLGAEVAYTSAGAVDVNKTFLNTIDALKRIEDPTKRAELAAKTLGKGWQDMAELINMGSADLQASLASVSDAKVIDDKEVQKAREFRAALDNLADQGQDLALSLGEFLVPILTDLLGILGTLTNAIKAVFNAFDSVADFLSGEGLEKLVTNLKTQEELNDTLGDQYKAYYSSRRAAVALTDALENHRSVTRTVDDQWQRLLGTLSDQEAWNNLLDSLDAVEESSYNALVDGTAQSARKAQTEIANLTSDLYDYIQGLDSIPPEIQTRIIGLLERGAFDEALAIVNSLRQGAVVPITPQPGAYNPPKPGQPTGGGGVIPNPIIGIGPRALMGTSTTGSAVVVNVAGSVVTEGDLVNKVRKGLIDAQRNGAALVYTNT